MRIRKRQVPLPFSSISPLSDPNFNHPPVTVVQLPLRQQQQPPPPPPPTTTCFDDSHYYPSSESDHPNQPIGQPLPTHARDSSASHGSDVTTTHEQQPMKNTQDYLALNPGGGEEDENNNDRRKKNVSGAKRGSGSSSSHYQAIERWVEGEKAFPLKKRRGSVETKADDAGADTKRPTKSIASKNMMTSVDNYDNSNGAKKRGGRGGALMEGSRCSRVNGRGWRCCQQTLVGYSLCEHHLGKGRLRSISSIRNRAKEERQVNNIDDHQGPILISSNPCQQLGKQTKSELQHKPLMMTKKRVKLGMVKARLMSSLMSQNNNAIAIVDDSN